MPRDDEHEMLERQASGRADSDIAVLPYVRLSQRGRPPRARRSAWALLAVVLAVHGLLAWVVYLVLRPVPHGRNERDVLQVTLIESAAGLPPPSTLVPPPPLPGRPPSAPAAHVHYEPPTKGAMSATLEGVKSPPLQLYAPNGQLRLPPNPSAGAAQAPAYRAPEIKGSQIYSGESPVPYQPTRFNKDWAPVNESLGAKTVGRAIDKVIEKTTVEKTVRLPGDIKLHCALSPLELLAGCKGVDPQPPPKNDNDIRLSMPPPETLTGKKVPLPKPASGAAAAASSQPPPAAASSR